VARPRDLYTAEYYRHIEGGSLESARHIVPLLIQLVRPARVLDVGCGTGAWLRVLREHGIADVRGIDVGAVPIDALLFPKDRFRQVAGLSPFDPPGAFDLVLSLEVAEHLPKESADRFITSLTACGPAVLFSAAIPGQGGTGHLNEQWPDYWAAKFLRHDYVCLDCFRWQIWNNSAVRFWFRQNLLLFVHRSRLGDLPAAVRASAPMMGAPVSLVHPELFRLAIKR
jgi:SAM-dependent methyltransferase